jgi:thiol-disulfide isomerase/thioredoxin
MTKTLTLVAFVVLLCWCQQGRAQFNMVDQPSTANQFHMVGQDRIGNLAMVDDVKPDTATEPDAGNLSGFILVFTSKGCGPCRTLEQPGGAFPALRSTGWSIGPEGKHLRVIDVDQNPLCAEAWKVTSLPCFIRVRDSKEVSRRTGALSHQQIAALWGSDSVGNVVTFPFRQHWTHPADIRKHLLEDHRYTGPLPPTYDGMEKLHNSLHDGITSPTGQQLTSAASSGNFCPTCPTGSRPKRSVRSFLFFRW